jgi:CRISPR-associated protein Csd1
MILQRLAEHYDRIVAEAGDIPKTGFSNQLVSFCVVLKPHGELVHFEDLRHISGKAVVPKVLKLPGQTKSSGKGFNPCFLWDRIGYLLGVNYEEGSEKRERTLKAFEAFKEKHLKYRDQIDDIRFNAVCNFLESWRPEAHSNYEPGLEEMARDCGVFRIAGDTHYIHELVALPENWSAPKEQSPPEDAVRMCLVTGELTQIARLHKPEIKGVFDADPKGMPLVSFNVPASNSYGNEQGLNAPVGESVAFKYANALNYLLRQRRIRIGDATVVYWADHHTPVEDVFAQIFQDNPPEGTDEAQEDVTRLEQAKQLLLQMRSGTQPVKWKTDDVPTRFFILGLSPNASRLSVRFWVEADASEILHRLETHIRDLSLNGVEELPSIWRIAQAAGRWDTKNNRYDSDSVSPKLAGDLTRAILTGAAYPQSLLATLIRRISMDGYVRSDRACAIKACILRNTRPTANPLEIPMELNESSTDIAYRCGCLFAILEKAQKDSADGELNATIKDRYFSSASATPGIVFPRLFRLNGHHLGKLETRARIYYERMIAPIMSEPFEFPRRLSLLEQGRFIVGYFQQNQRLYARKQESKTEENS